MNRSQTRGALSAVSMFFLMAHASLQAATFIPIWNGDPWTTSATFDFNTSSKSALPESSTNPYGSPSLLVQNETVYGAGWMDPEQTDHLTRGPGNGAWDLGRNGKITIAIPISDAGNSSAKNVDLVLNLVWYNGPMGAPDYTVAGLSPWLTESSQELVELDAAGSWERTTWTASFTNVMDDWITLEIVAPWNGAVVDSVGFHTRFSVIPEPGSALLACVAVVGSVTFRRRKAA